MRSKFLAFLTVLSQPVVAIGGSIAIAVLAVGGAWYLTQVGATGVYTTATLAPITQEVDVSGVVQGAETTDLSFQISGQVASVPGKVGQQVGAGQVLVALSGGAQSASLAGAQANLESAKARLAALNAGTRPEQIAVDQSALRNAITNAYSVADGAVHTTADQFFTNGRTGSATLTIIVPDSVLVNRLTAERVALEPILAQWNADISTPTFLTGDPTAASNETSQELILVNTFLNDAASALTKAQASGNITATMLSGYQSAIASARTSVAGSLSAVTSAQGALTLASAPPTATDVASAQASVDAAQAAVDSAKVSSGQTVLVAPISGTITVQNAHLGQTVAPGVVLVSMQGTGAYEAKAPVSESDIGKLKIGQAVNASFDAYPGVAFPATVTAVDPAATMTNGVSSYQVTATFTANDPRVQSGLTAHLSIVTATATDTLVVPASAVISDGTTQFVYVQSGKNTSKTPVTTGIESASGMVEIRSGISAGAKVLTFGNSK